MEFEVGQNVIARFGDALIMTARIEEIEPKLDGLPNMVRVEILSDGISIGVSTWIESTDVIARVLPMPASPLPMFRTILDPETGLRFPVPYTADESFYRRK